MSTGMYEAMVLLAGVYAGRYGGAVVRRHVRIRNRGTARWV